MAENDAALDWVLDPRNLAPVEVQTAVTRNCAIAGLAAFEQFLKERGEEWATHLSSARISPNTASLNSGLFYDRLVKTLPRRFSDLDAAGREILVKDLSTTLASFSGSTFVAHNLYFAWPGSNVQSSDIETVVNLIGFSDGWRYLSAILARLSSSSLNQSARDKMESFARLRHSVAHSVDETVPDIVALAISGHVLTTALLLDIAVSEGIGCAKRNVRASTRSAADIRFRRLEQDSTRWLEFAPKTKTKATPRAAAPVIPAVASRSPVKAYKSLEDAMRGAKSRAGAQGDVIVAFDSSGRVADWHTFI